MCGYLLQLGQKPSKVSAYGIRIKAAAKGRPGAKKYVKGRRRSIPPVPSSHGLMETHSVIAFQID